MDKQGEGKVRMLAGTVASELGFDLVDVSLSGSARRALLRITIDTPGGVTLDDCETFSRRIESLLDVGVHALACPFRRAEHAEAHT